MILPSRLADNPIQISCGFLDCYCFPLAPLWGSFKEVKAKLYCAAGLAPAPFLWHFLLREAALQVPSYGIKSRGKCNNAAFLEISSGQTKQAALNNIRKCIFPVLRE